MRSGNGLDGSGMGSGRRVLGRPRRSGRRCGRSGRPYGLDDDRGRRIGVERAIDKHIDPISGP